MTELTLDDVRLRLSQAVRDAGPQRAPADRAGVSRPYLSEVLSGRRTPGTRLLAAVDLMRVERFVSLSGRH